MSISQETIEFALELFEPLGGLSTRKMMGGLCIYFDKQIFAVVDQQGTIFLKAKGEFAKTLADTGSRQFGADGGGSMGYWTLPDDALDDPAVASDWARRALAHL